MAERAKRIPQLDGIRGTAILLVMVWHFAIVPLQTGAATGAAGAIGKIIAHVGLLTWSGVDLFFVLSGFLIGGILTDARDSPNYFRTFYMRRVFRILPIYLALIVPYLAIWSVASNKAGLTAAVGAPLPWYVYLTFTQNFWLAHHSWDAVYLALTWSLAVEEQFYLLLPAIIRVVPRGWLLRVSALIAILCVAARAGMYLHYGSSWGDAAYVLIFCRADALMLGVICAVLLRDARWKEFLLRERWIVAAGAVIFGAGVAVLTYKGWGMGTRPMCTLGFTCLALFYASVLMITMVSPNGAVSRIFQMRWLMWMGTIAYGLYLLHGFAAEFTFWIAGRLGIGSSGLAISATTVVAVGVALGAAWLSWTFFEARLVRMGHRFTYGRL